MMRSLNQNVLDPDPGQRAAVPLRPAHALAALLLEDADLWSASLAVDDADDPGVGDKRRAGEHLAAVLFEHQHLVDAHFLAGLDIDAVHGDDRPGRHLDLPSAALNDCEHVQLPKAPRQASSTTGKASRVTRKVLRSKHLRVWSVLVDGLAEAGHYKTVTYLRRTRVPRTFCVLRVLRKNGMSLSISS